MDSTSLGLLAGESVLVLGLGDSGLAMARWCVAEGAATVAVWDSREQAPQDALLAAELPQVARQHGTPVLPAGCTRVLKSPGLSPLDARIAAVAGAGVPVQGELDLFAQALDFLKREWRYEPAVLAITGTNGKTTTTALTGQLCEAAGRRVAVAGNIGPTLLDTLRAALVAEGPRPQVELPLQEPPEAAEPAMPAVEPGHEAAEAGEAPADTDKPEDGVSIEQLDEMLHPHALPIEPPPPRAPEFAALPQVWVLELSSFQLDGVKGFEPTAATVLNLTQDHLDWHGDMAAYGAAKARVFGSQGLMVINRDDPLVEAMVPQPPPPPMGARGKPLKVALKWTPRRVCRFGLQAPQQAGDFGLLVENGMAWLVRALPQDETPLRKRQPRAEEDIQLQRLMPADALRIRGRHNAANALAALALATAAGCPLAPMLHRLREYRGEPHRVEWLLTLQGVDFVDDSKGTNVGATVAAIRGLGADREAARLVLILGGDGKGQDFEPLREPLARHARAVALIGRHEATRAALQELLQGADYPVQAHDSLEAATTWAFAQAKAGDTVLLSPACASLDMFRNYAHRAEVFLDAARTLAAERGELA
ncbi:Mur ligase family protein [Inhella sp.]|uniref:Mur ligase family protein n=1 Tax=Inhella sp. TaxID=1921806 RepID=UPI0035B4B0F1